MKQKFGCSYENVYWYHNQVYSTTNTHHNRVHGEYERLIELHVPITRKSRTASLLHSSKTKLGTIESA